MLAFSALTVRICWFLVQSLPHYFGLWRSYWEIMLAFRAVAVRLCRPLAQLQGDYVGL